MKPILTMLGTPPLGAMLPAKQKMLATALARSQPGLYIVRERRGTHTIVEDIASGGVFTSTSIRRRLPIALATSAQGGSFACREIRRQYVFSDAGLSHEVRAEEAPPEMRAILTAGTGRKVIGHDIDQPLAEYAAALGAQARVSGGGRGGAESSAAAFELAEACTPAQRAARGIHFQVLFAGYARTCIQTYDELPRRHRTPWTYSASSGTRSSTVPSVLIPTATS